MSNYSKYYLGWFRTSIAMNWSNETMRMPWQLPCFNSFLSLVTMNSALLSKAAISNMSSSGSTIPIALRVPSDQIASYRSRRKRAVCLCRSTRLEMDDLSNTSISSSSKAGEITNSNCLFAHNAISQAPAPRGAKSVETKILVSITAFTTRDSSEPGGPRAPFEPQEAPLPLRSSRQEAEAPTRCRNHAAVAVLRWR